MNMTRPRIIGIAGVAALLVASLLATRAAAQDQPPAAGQAAPARIGRASADLGLSAEQEKALREFRQARREESRAFREEMGRLRGELRELARNPEANRAKIDALIDKQAGLRAERQKGAFRARAERDKIFTPEQREKIRSFRSRAAGRTALGRRAALGRAPWRAARWRALRHHPFFRRGW
jgi:Spy/CpxP family protein refolding chaperone